MGGKDRQRRKTIEVRKTRPKLETPFKCYIYCTVEMAEYDALWVLDAPTREKYSFIAVSAYLENPKGANKGNSKVIGEFICDRIFPINVFDNGSIQNWLFEHMERSCLTYEELAGYIGNGKTGYGWHIVDLKIYETPKKLTEFHTWKKCKSCSKSGYESTACIYDENCMVPMAITKAPQSWCYVESNVMGQLWDYCAFCGKRIETGEKCYGLPNGESVCTDCCVAENEGAAVSDGEEEQENDNG